MKTLYFRNSFAALAAMSLAVAGCASETEAPPTTNPQDVVSGDDAGDGTDGTDTTDDGTDTTDDGTDTIDDGTDTTDDGTDATDGTDDCEGPEGCYDCPASTSLQLLNACTDVTCVPFDNTAHINHPDFEEGQPLPPLP